MGVIIDFIYNFYQKNKDALECLPDHQNPVSKGVWKYLPVGFHPDHSELPLLNLLVDEFFSTFITPNINNISVDLHGHFSNLPTDSLADIQNHPDDSHPLKLLNIRNMLSFTLIDVLIHIIYQKQIEFLPILFRIDDGQITFAEHPHCVDCGRPLYITLDVVLQAITITPRMSKQVPTCVALGQSRTIQVTIPVPSHTLVFANDLRSLLTTEEKNILKKQSADSFVGRQNASQEAAKIGMLYAYISNTCPSIIEENGLILIATNIGYQSFHHIDCDEFKLSEHHPGYKGYICTDLWWYCGMDKIDFLRRCRQLDCDPASYAPVYVPTSGHIATLSHVYDENINHQLADHHHSFPAFSTISFD